MSLRVAEPLCGWCPEENGLRDAWFVSKAARLQIAGKMPATHTAGLRTIPLGRSIFLGAAQRRSNLNSQHERLLRYARNDMSQQLRRSVIALEALSKHLVARIKSRVAAASEGKRSLPMVFRNAEEPSASLRLPLPPILHALKSQQTLRGIQAQSAPSTNKPIAFPFCVFSLYATRYLLPYP
jgi:hypothetical protein